MSENTAEDEAGSHKNGFHYHLTLSLHLLPHHLQFPHPLLLPATPHSRPRKLHQPLNPKPSTSSDRLHITRDPPLDRDDERLPYERIARIHLFDAFIWVRIGFVVESD